MALQLKVYDTLCLIFFKAKNQREIIQILQAKSEDHNVTTIIQLSPKMLRQKFKYGSDIMNGDIVDATSLNLYSTQRPIIVMV